MDGVVIVSVIEYHIMKKTKPLTSYPSCHIVSVIMQS